MESLAQLLFTIGTVVLAIAFAAHIGHAVLLANGRRLVGVVGTVRAPAMQPAWAGVASGSFIESRSAAEAAGPAPFASPSPLSRAALWLAIGAVATPAAST